jgi:polysaccharide biosynthesis protein PslG
MFTSHPRRPHRAWAQQPVTLLVATCLTLLAIGAGAAARTTQPSATISSTALHNAIAVRAADRRTLTHTSAALSACLRRHPTRCRAQRRAFKHAHAKLLGAKRRVSSLSANIARRRHAAAGGTSTATQTPTLTVSGHRLKGSTIGNVGSEGNSGGSAGSSTSNFELPFAKGVDTNLQGWGPAAEPQITHEITAVGAHWAREDLNWSKVEPQRGVFDWSSFDQMVSIAKANGITILPVAGYSPSWTTPDNSSDYAAFIAAAVARYGPGTAANLQTWELWNEPYYAYAWSGKPGDPAAYARDVEAASQAAKQVAPSVRILMAAEDGDAAAAGGGWWTTSVQDYFTAVPDLGKWIDGVAVHPYGDDPSVPVKEADGFRGATGGWSFQRIDSIRAEFTAHGVNVPFWITEIGWTTSEVSEATQAHNYEDLTAQVAARPWVRGMFSYCLREFNSDPANSEAQFGLEKYGSWQPKLAFYALQKGFAALS